MVTRTKYAIFIPKLLTTFQIVLHDSLLNKYIKNVT